ncbi:MAG: rhomboid family intramembrane serine protease [Bryobacteraceae bacterium]|nr:rhomboid family intramembrane serine protease [Bryobacteraceae bacterium]MDW8377601.1 rhomboid family intramembrane serine protease [Bryobacterales bacterium]
MRYASRNPGYLSHEFFPPGVKWLLIVNIGLFVVYFLAYQFGFGYPFRRFGLIPRDVVSSLALWQLVTYLFLHDPTGFSHILLNMLTLYMFGADLERQWGTREFLKFYFLCGVGAGVCVVVANALVGAMGTRTIGASGAIYGLLLAFGMLYPDRTVLFNFLFPIKAKYFVMIIGAMTFLLTIGASGGNVSHFAHLGGMLFAYLYLKGARWRWSPLESLRQAYRDWKLRRAKKRFQVYLRKQNSKHDPFIH